MKNYLMLLCLIIFSAVTSSTAQTVPGTVLWSYQAPGLINSSPALAADGTVYVGIGSALWAITNSGSTASNKWTFPAPPTLSASVGPDGTIYFGSGQCNLYAVHPDGTLAWVLPLQPEFQYQISFSSTPAIGADGTLYFVAGGRLYSVSATGTKNWEFVTDVTGAGQVAYSPVIGADGTIYVGSSYNRTFFAVTPDGTNKWSATLAANGNEAAAIGSDGSIYYPDNSLYAWTSQGSNLWIDANYYYAPPVIGPSGNIYLAGGHTIYAVSSVDQPLWHAISGNGLVAPPAAAIDAGETIYFCASNSIWALDAHGQVRWNLTQPGDPGPSGDFARSSPTIGPDGTLYVALGPTLYAIATGTNGPASSAWPMYQQNARHTGKVERPVLKHPHKRTDANFEFQLYPQQLGLSYTIQTSTNLNTWTSLTNFVATTLPVDITDLTASNSGVRFYRAFSPP
jgi:outer membrane protein assembly factor BamB